jgi:hypothetical protein
MVQFHKEEGEEEEDQITIPSVSYGDIPSTSLLYVSALKADDSMTDVLVWNRSWVGSVKILRQFLAERAVYSKRHASPYSAVS